MKDHQNHISKEEVNKTSKDKADLKPTPFKEEANRVEADPNEEAALEQQRKDALTERD